MRYLFAYSLGLCLWLGCQSGKQAGKCPELSSGALESLSPDSVISEGTRSVALTGRTSPLPETEWEKAGCLSRLQWNYAELRFIPTGGEKGLPEMLWMELAENEIDNADVDWNKLPQLQRLDLSFNQLTQVPSRLFEGPLREFRASSNQIAAIEFPPGSRLHVLNLRGNRLSVFQMPGKGWKSLQELDLSQNELTGFQSGRADSLQLLNLAGNQLDSVQLDLHDFPRLQDMYFNGNPLRVLQFTHSEDALVESLYLSETLLKGLPDGAASLPRLQRLILSDCRITELSSFNEGWSGLTELDVSRNAISRIPPNWMPPANLRHLNLSRNPLQALPADLSGWKSLETLDLSGIDIAPTEKERIERALPATTVNFGGGR